MILEMREPKNIMSSFKDSIPKPNSKPTPSEDLLVIMAAMNMSTKSDIEHTSIYNYINRISDDAQDHALAPSQNRQENTHRSFASCWRKYCQESPLVQKIQRLCYQD